MVFEHEGQRGEVEKAAVEQTVESQRKDAEVQHQHVDVVVAWVEVYPKSKVWVFFGL